MKDHSLPLLDQRSKGIALNMHVFPQSSSATRKGNFQRSTDVSFQTTTNTTLRSKNRSVSLRPSISPSMTSANKTRAAEMRVRDVSSIKRKSTAVIGNDINSVPNNNPDIETEVVDFVAENNEQNKASCWGLPAPSQVSLVVRERRKRFQSEWNNHAKVEALRKYDEWWQMYSSGCSVHAIPLPPHCSASEDETLQLSSRNPAALTARSYRQSSLRMPLGPKLPTHVRHHQAFTQQPVIAAVSGSLMELHKARRVMHNQSQLSALCKNIADHQLWQKQVAANRVLASVFLTWYHVLKSGFIFADQIAQRWGKFDDEKRRLAIFQPPLGEKRLFELRNAERVVQKCVMRFKLRKIVEIRREAVALIVNYLQHVLSKMKVRWAKHRFLVKIRQIQRAFRVHRYRRLAHASLWRRQVDLYERRIIDYLKLKRDLDIKRTHYCDMIRESIPNTVNCRRAQAFLRKTAMAGRSKMALLRHLETDRHFIEVVIPPFEMLPQVRASDPTDIMTALLLEELKRREEEQWNRWRDYLRSKREYVDRIDWLNEETGVEVVNTKIKKAKAIRQAHLDAVAEAQFKAEADASAAHAMSNRNSRINTPRGNSGTSSRSAQPQPQPPTLALMDGLAAEASFSTSAAVPFSPAFPAPISPTETGGLPVLSADDESFIANWLPPDPPRFVMALPQSDVLRILYRKQRQISKATSKYGGMVALSLADTRKSDEMLEPEMSYGAMKSFVYTLCGWDGLSSPTTLSDGKIGLFGGSDENEKN